jgi:hypothetical protein
MMRADICSNIILGTLKGIQSTSSRVSYNRNDYVHIYIYFFQVQQTSPLLRSHRNQGCITMALTRHFGEVNIIFETGIRWLFLWSSVIFMEDCSSVFKLRYPLLQLESKSTELSSAS